MARPKDTTTLTNLTTVGHSNGTIARSVVKQDFPCNHFGQKFPNYRDIIKKHQNANTTSYTTAWVDNFRMATGTISTEWYEGFVPKSSFSTHEHMGGGCFPGSIPVDTTLRDQALAKLKAKIANNTAEFNSLVPLGEIKELRGLISQSANLASTLMTGLVNLKRGNIRGALSQASDMWLGFNFGVKPILSDTKAVAESIAAFLEQPARTQRFSANKSKDWVSRVNSSPLSMTADYCSVNCTGTLYHNLTYNYTAGCVLDIQACNNYRLMNQLGFPAQNLIPAAWELVPYSWVMDYFTTAGDYLSDVFSANGNYTHYVTLSTLYTTNYTGSYEIVQSPLFGGVQRSGYIGSSLFEGGRYSRVNVGSQLPRRELRLKTIDEIELNNITKLLNLTACLYK